MESQPVRTRRSMLFLEFRLSKDLRLEDREAGARPPGVGGESRLEGQIVEHLVETPALLDGNLRQEHRRAIILAEDDAVAADDDLPRRPDRSERREHRDFDLEAVELPRLDLAEAR